MPGRLHEGMTRTQTHRKTRRPRAAYLTLAAVALLIVLGWTAASLTGLPESREVQAQTSDDPDDSENGSGNELQEPSYESFGDRKDPFALVVQEAAEGDGGGGGDSTPDSDGAEDSGSNNGMDNGGGDQEGASQGGADEGNTTTTDDAEEPSPEDTAPAEEQEQSQASSGSGAVPENVDCGDPEDEFEQLLCEDAASGADGSSGDAPSGDAQPGSDDERFGGSGRSGAGEPEESFRNGGAAVGK